MLGLLSLAPHIIGAVGSIVGAVTGHEPPPSALASPTGMADHIAGLPPEQQQEIKLRTLDHIERLDANSTERWKARLDAESAADVEKLRATARPRIALQAMTVVRAFMWVMVWAMAALSLEWLARAGFEIWGCSESTGPDGRVIELCKTFPVQLSVAHMLAQLEPVVDLIWPPLIASLAACVAVIKAYMGARERDKARADEMTYGKPLDSTAATIAAAGGGVAGIIRAIKGAK